MSDAPRPRCDLDEMEARARAVCKDHREYSNSDYDAFVQAADATTVLELVRRLREAEETIEEMRSNALERGERD